MQSIEAVLQIALQY